MALTEQQVRTGVLTGWTEPKPYAAGEYKGNPFPAGRSFQMWLTTEPHDVDRLKVKDAECDAIYGAIMAAGLFGTVEVEFSTFGGEARALAVKVIKAAKPAPAAA